MKSFLSMSIRFQFYFHFYFISIPGEEKNNILGIKGALTLRNICAGLKKGVEVGSY